jgi:hypothetical protein
MALHDHYGIFCGVADSDRNWCEHIEFVLTHIAQRRPDAVRYLRERLAFGSAIDAVPGKGAFILNTGDSPATGCIALKPVANDDVEDMRYTIAHELAHAYHLLGASDIDAEQGTKTEFTQRQREEAADKIVADDWALVVPDRDMAPYDLIDAIDVIQAQNSKKKTEGD